MAIGERIKSARKAQGLSLRALADRIGLSHNAIAKYEKNDVVPGSGILLNLSDELCVPVDFFFRQGNVELRKPKFRHPKSGMPKKEEQKLLARVKDWLERYFELELIAEANNTVKFSFPSGFPMKVGNFDDVEQAAKKLRERWKLGADAIDNMVALLEDKGIKIYQIKMVSDFDAAVIPSSGDEFIFVINTSFTPDHQRLSLAHELGHLMMKIPRKSDEEDFAFRFAASFLVPQSIAYMELGKKRKQLSIPELSLMKHKYGLSMQAWIRRAGELGIISAAYENQLLAGFKKAGWHELEPGEQCVQEKPQQMEKLAYKALAEGLITESRAFELLGKPINRSFGFNAAQIK